MITIEQVKSVTPAKFWNKIKFAEPDQCWEWQGALNEDGYGRFWTWVSVKKSSSVEASHRKLYLLLFGELQKDICVLHKCDNPKCCNPNHLWPGTRADNNRDMISKGRARHDANPRGSEHKNSKLTEAQVIELRRRINNGEKQKVVAKDFNMSRAQTCVIANGKRWKHVM